MFEIVETTFESKAIEDIFKGDFLQKVYGEVRKMALDFTPNLETEKGRKEIASQAYKVAQSKTFIEKHGKKYSGRLKASAKLVDKARKTFRDQMDDLRDEIRQPLSEWEESEKKRIEAEDLALEVAEDHEEALIMNEEFDRQIKEARKLKEKLAEIKRKEAEIERRELEAKIKADAEKEAERKRLQYIKEAEEAAKRAKQEAIDEAARIKREAAEEVARQAEERRRAAEEAERAKIQAVKDVKEKAERERFEREAARKKAEEQKAWEEAERQKKIAKLKADEDHRAEIRAAVITSFRNNNYTHDESRQLVELIESEMIDFVRIQF